ncbi:rhomboid-like protein [Mycobacterium sp. NPDC003449]
MSGASTNLHNLRHGHLGTLLGSAFVTDSGPVYTWLPGLMCLLALGELLWRSGRLLLTFTLGHVGATLLVAVGLTVTVKAGWTPVSVGRDVDVGMSYGAAAVLGALTAAIPSRWRPAWIGWWLGVVLGVVTISRDFTDIGHAVALLLGMVLSGRLGPPEGWTLCRYLLLSVAAAFGFALLAGGGELVAVTGGAGLIGAAAGYALGNAFGARSAHRL